MRLFRLLPLALAALIVSGPAFALTSGKSGDHSKGIVLLGDGLANCKTATKGGIRYNSTTPGVEYCDGTAWQTLAKVQGSDFAAPAGSGYFVLTHDTWNGNLGGLAGADAKCLSDLTTYTSWQGHADAASRSLLNSTKVHAFVCIYGTSSSNLTASTTYYFSNAGNSSAGGAYFTTDSSTQGPGNSMIWSAANYFYSTSGFWTGRYYTSDTLWSTGYDCCGATAITCNNWASSSNANTADIGLTSNADKYRWAFDANAGNRTACDQSEHLVCYVNP